MKKRTKVYEMVSMANVDTIFDGKFINDLFNRLESFGYTPKENDIFNIGFSISKVNNDIKNICNISTIPPELYETLIDFCVVEILAILFYSGKLDETFSLNELIKTVNVGDTSVTFDNSVSASEQIESLITILKQKAERSVLCYRKIKW